MILKKQTVNSRNSASVGRYKQANKQKTHKNKNVKIKDKEKVVHVPKDIRSITYKGTRKQMIDLFMTRCKLLPTQNFIPRKNKKQNSNVGVKNRWNKRKTNTQTIDFNHKISIIKFNVSRLKATIKIKKIIDCMK